MRLEGKSIVVTGASSGMGREIVRLFAMEGAKVTAVARRRERLEELRNELRDAPGTVEIFAGDVSLRETNEGMIAFARERFGRLDALINNAGVMDDMSPVGDVTDENYERIMKINLYGPICAMRSAIAAFREQGSGGCIVNVASVGAMRTAAGALYGASKAALVAISKNTAFMYIPEGIRCNVIAPGGFKTEISGSMGNPNMAGYARVQKVLAAAPEPGEPVEIARAALFLISDEALYVNGDVMVVDGGWTAG